jgi:hypothetical protein
MKTVQATYAGGVFHPRSPVPLPERCEVEFEPRVVRARPRAGWAAALAAVPAPVLAQDAAALADFRDAPNAVEDREWAW